MGLSLDIVILVQLMIVLLIFVFTILYLYFMLKFFFFFLQVQDVKSSVATSLLLGLMIYVLLSQPRLYYLFLFLLTQSIKLVLSLYKPLCSMGIALTTYTGTEHARQQAGTLDRLINPHTRPG